MSRSASASVENFCEAIPIFNLKQKQLRRLLPPQLPDVLLDGAVVVSFQVQVVTVMPEDLGQSIAVQMLALGQVDGHHKQVLLK